MRIQPRVQWFGTLGPVYVFSAGTELPLPVRNERGGGRGEGHPIADTTAHPQAEKPSSPQPSPPSEGGEGEDYRTLNTYGPVRAGFTLPEVMVAMSILIISIGGMVLAHVVSARMMEITNAKASASADARRNISTLMTEVCSANQVVVGSGNLTSFSAAGMDVLQKGPALQIYPSTATNVFIRYFLDTATKSLKRATNGAVAADLVAGAINNTYLFTAEDYAGNVLSNSQNNCVIGLALQFYQVENANLPVGPNERYTSYQVQTKIARRSP